MLERRIEKKIKKRKTLITASTIAVSAAILIGIALGTSLFNIREITVEKNILVSAEEIITLSQIEKENIFLLNKEKIKEKIQLNPYIDSVILKRKLPATVIIEVKEKKIKGLVKFENSFINIDSEGNMVHIVNKFPDGKIPLIEGVTVEQYVQNGRLIKENEIMEKALRQVLTIPDYEGCEGVFYSVNIKDPYRIVLTTKDKLQIDIGDYTNMDYKLGYALELIKNEAVKGKQGYIEILSDGSAISR